MVQKKKEEEKIAKINVSRKFSKVKQRSLATPPVQLYPLRVTKLLSLSIFEAEVKVSPKNFSNLYTKTAEMRRINEYKQIHAPTHRRTEQYTYAHTCACACICHLMYHIKLIGNCHEGTTLFVHIDTHIYTYIYIKI